LAGLDPVIGDGVAVGGRHGAGNGGPGGQRGIDVGNDGGADDDDVRAGVQGGDVVVDFVFTAAE
jgi:hypothetical protein